ncbi:MAG: signal peptidase II [Acidimicrobiales bacterium]
MDKRSRLLVAGIAGAVVAVDQLTKWWALEVLGNRTIDVVWTLQFRLLFNKGSAFGFGSRFTPLITLIAITIVVFFLRTGSKYTSVWPRVAMALVVGGALGNLVDRLFRDGSGFLGGAVVDFLDLQWWPVFNLADVAISFGAVLLVITSSSSSEDDNEPETSGVDEKRAS